MINGVAHGPMRGTAACQLHMRTFKDGDVISVEPWRVRAFPVVRDLVVDRSALDRIVQAGGYITAPTGGAQDANTILIPKETVDIAMDAAQCIGCGACVAACPNGSASLFTASKSDPPGSVAPGTAGALPPRPSHGGADGHRALRGLYPVRGMSGSMSQANQHRHYHPDEPRLPSGQPDGRSRRRCRVRLNPSPAVLLLALAVPSTLRAQTSPWFRIGANGIPAYTRVDPVPGDRPWARSGWCSLP